MRRGAGGGVGLLTPRRAALVADEKLARWAAELELGPLLRLGRGAEQTGGGRRESILATTLEAVLGALYLEAGCRRGAAGRRAAGGLVVRGGLRAVLG